MSVKYYVYFLIDSRNSQPFYVGKGSGNRMYNHKHESKQGTKPHHHRIREILESGGEVMPVKVFEFDDEIEALNKEREMIEQVGRETLNTGPLLNITLGGQNGGNVNAKPVSQYDMEGNFIATYPSAKVAAENVSSANRSYITQCCKLKRKSSGNWQWRYENDAPPPPVKYIKQYKRPVKQLTKDGMFVKRWDSLTEAANYHNVNVRTISHACAGRYKTCKGFVWTYAD